MPIPMAPSTAALLTASHPSAAPTVLSKLSQPGSRGLSAGSAGFVPLVLVSVRAQLHRSV